MNKNRNTFNNRSQSNQNNHLNLYKREDPFRQMNQIMHSFGSFGGNNFFKDDFFKGSMMNRFQDPFDSMMNFSDMHKNIHKNGKEGSYVSQTFVSTSAIGSDGKMHKQSYYQNSAGQHKGNQTISQKQQAYKDTNGINRIAEQRMLNDRGHKVVKQKRGNQIEETNHYYNMDEDQRQNFHNSWGRSNNQIGFLQNHQKYMRGIQNSKKQQRNLGIGYEPKYNQQIKNDQRLMQKQKNGINTRDDYELKNTKIRRQSGRNAEQYSNPGSRSSGYSNNGFKRQVKY